MGLGTIPLLWFLLTGTGAKSWGEEVKSSGVTRSLLKPIFLEKFSASGKNVFENLREQGQYFLPPVPR